ncbi:EI24 domain-containing protein [Sphingomonas donggukensis]|uniref:EI24 domain-containing protein n=1 Tax=Sphingomonas donggukensis TaxID=2949093 RepID=A0ABY4TUH3_9SPHN|nr:EI24 domain-containing protein [Sphingomonas donggukensis]URW74809.1 EI24 domain-containing protein [Sphingomonas donggukensis]
MLTAFTLSLAQLGDRAFLAVLAKSLAVTLALLSTLGAGLWFGARALAAWLGATEGLSGIAGFLALLGGLAIGWLIFRAIAIAAVGLFADEVVEAVEAKHYPAALASARPVPFVRSLAMGAGGIARTILVNLAATPLYILLFATGIGTPIGFFAVNAVLLGRDLGDMVAARHLPAEGLAEWRRTTRARRWTLGAAGTALLLIPVLNLIAPIVSAAMATHLFHRRQP